MRKPIVTRKEKISTCSKCVGTHLGKIRVQAHHSTLIGISERVSQQSLSHPARRTHVQIDEALVTGRECRVWHECSSPLGSSKPVHVKTNKENTSTRALNVQAKVFRVEGTK